MKTYLSREIYDQGSCDVVVAGGGVAGCAAALSAARCGMRTLLIEKSVLLGGLATLGLITWYDL
jgi:NADPH-dependent 2,4-dienoyl-CoA reductase/sulfur reductase-like enzyme